MSEGVVNESDLLIPQPASDQDILLVHDHEYLEKLKLGSLSDLEIAVMEIPFSRELFDFFVLAAGGTLLASRTALEDGACFNLSGGFHHAFPDHGEGFCMLNDVAMAAARLLADEKAHRVLIIDCDLHQGNGTASIFSNTREVFTFSIHQENNYPFVKPRGSLDIGLLDGTSGAEYNDYLGRTLPRVFDEFSPEFVFFLAGADPFEDDQLGMLRLSKEELKERDRLVMEMSLGRGVPICGVLAGGYAWKIEDTVEIHYNTIVTAKQVLESHKK